MQTKNKPLYKVLNENRTQGTAKVENNPPYNEWYLVGGITFPVYVAHFKADNVINELEAKANVEYAALAVNNLHHLASTLEMWLEYMDSDLSEAEQRLVDITKEALLKII